ncbi:Component of the post-replicative DNA mismatch repair system (MMR). Heterodimerizes with msh-2 to form MutS beta [Seminavis robusta]|uniref:Component of the post-replicative DNA mismatch repair system (MMR). Heterodimerizes with msh-2 to form MutS beta n=1 Tax=Seminavis robusta TaxID=568900 RepID=A0A9N8HQS9_9STRA|nr:Component of the post-replicative DNA mismatch repair system (MMR). Heterodimerizes with msh-2 to form MutS beta [Seminavis robusta]|eukprot:Sro1192_g251040.1 Component of the post-replicative DNA mismatch repair system (MMR). Heterodimerizes with msh-2 to form MutS beta (235) ;mRNA; r:10581-11357
MQRDQLEQHKDEMCAVLTPKSLVRTSWKYSGTDLDSKDKYIIELPIGVTVPTDFWMVGKRGKGQKQICKYQSAVVQELVVSLEQAIEAHKERKTQHMQHVFARFDAKRNLWEQVKHVSAMLDALGSLANFCGPPGYCRPQILECPPDATPCIEIVQGRHPCVESTPGSSEFLPKSMQVIIITPQFKLPELRNDLAQMKQKSNSSGRSLPLHAPEPMHSCAILASTGMQRLTREN